ncbi:MAG: MarR family transcriptional regulator [Lactobacillaceae bacterium]|jgi:DNA-binding MarR family transcriptional regulator|nr:MarR family transcriptional regulator [Lactobacillaceae bacterium]
MSKYDQIQALIRTMSDANHEEDSEIKWFLKHATLPSTVDIIKNAKNFTHSELEILSTLAQSADPITFKALQATSALSQGMLSRYINRLQKQQLLEKFHAATNKKEVWLKLSATGREIGALHLELHAQMHKDFEQVLSHYSDADIDLVIKFAQDVFTTRKNIQ